ncbi:MAG TPA: hypothetical protein VLS86_08825, partial [Acidimicrobiia bacterium]|nr:hypothetical protein [Acidimicrobiia bacterium]
MNNYAGLWLATALAAVLAYRRVMVLIAVVVALFALPASEAQAAPDTECRGTIFAVMIEGKIVVPDGAECELVGTTVDGSIIVGVGSTLIANGIEVLKPGTIPIQASGFTRLEVTGLRKFVGPGDPEELQPSEVLGSIQAVGGGTVIISDTILGGALQISDNSDSVLITDTFAEGAVQLGKNTGEVSVTDSFLGEGVEISETEGDVTFTRNTSDESDLTIGKTNGAVTVEDNPSLGENFEVSETDGELRVLGNFINDNMEISENEGGVIVSGNTIGDNLTVSKITGEVTFPVPCDPLDPECVLGETVIEPASVIIVGNTVGDGVKVLETTGEVIFAENVVEAGAQILQPIGQATANNHHIGFVPVPSGGSLEVTEASAGASVSF